MRLLKRAGSILALSAVLAFAQNANDVLISAEEAVKLIGQENVVFVSGDNDDVFGLGHIKGSVEMYAHHLHHSDINGRMKCAPLFMCVDEAQELIGKKGIDNDTLVIAYDDYRGPNATGVYAFFKSFGHEKVKILNGGRDAMYKIDPNWERYKELQKLIAEGKKNKMPDAELAKLEEESKSIEPKLYVQKGHEHIEHKKHYKIDPSKIDYELIAGKDELLKATLDIMAKGNDSEYIIIDSRGMPEVLGERKLDNVARGGHIPGAKFIEWSNFTDMENKLSFKKLEELQKVFDSYGITKDKKIYAYCHVGAGRSSDIIVALKLLGYQNAKVYTGSWDEWGNDMNLPIRR